MVVPFCKVASALAGGLGRLLLSSCAIAAELIYLAAIKAIEKIFFM